MAYFCIGYLWVIKVANKSLKHIIKFYKDSFIIFIRYGRNFSNTEAVYVIDIVTYLEHGTCWEYLCGTLKVTFNYNYYSKSTVTVYANLRLNKLISS